MWIWIGQMKITIAKLEGMFAVCKQKDKTEIFVNRRELPFDAKEGDVLVLGDDNIWKFCLSKDLIQSTAGVKK